MCADCLAPPLITSSAISSLPEIAKEIYLVPQDCRPSSSFKGGMPKCSMVVAAVASLSESIDRPICILILIMHREPARGQRRTDCRQGGPAPPNLGFMINDFVSPLYSPELTSHIKSSIEFTLHKARGRGRPPRSRISSRRSRSCPPLDLQTLR